MTLEEARCVVFKAKKELAKLYSEFGDLTWDEYLKKKLSFTPKLTHEAELFAVLEKLLTPLLGKEKTGNTNQFIKKTGFVSTCDHHGILHHPFFSNASLVRSFVTKNQPVVCFTCGSVSPSNSSYPRGISLRDDNHKEQKLSFISLRHRRRPLFGIPSFGADTISKIKSRISHLPLTQIKKGKLLKLFGKIESHKTIFDLPRTSDQFTIINDILWEHLFVKERGNLVYLEIESVVRTLLLDIHLDHNTFVHDIIFDTELRNQYLLHFQGITGAHDTSHATGSEIFWFIDELRNTRESLFIKDNAFVSKDGRIVIPIDKDVLRDFLVRFKLMPSMAFCYSVLSFYYGLTLGGGFSQIDYLGDMKHAWQKVAQYRNKKPIDTITNIFTGEFVLPRDTEGNSMTLIDILLNPAEIDSLIKTTPIKVTLDRMMPEFIEIVTGTREKIEDLG